MLGCAWGPRPPPYDAVPGWGFGEHGMKSRAMLGIRTCGDRTELLVERAGQVDMSAAVWRPPKFYTLADLHRNDFPQRIPYGERAVPLQSLRPIA